MRSRTLTAALSLLAALAATAAPAFAQVNGLSADYFDNSDFSGAVINQLDPVVDFNWGPTGATSTLPGGMVADTYSVRWQGIVQATTAGSYTFFTTTDDGVRLWVNGQLLVNQWGIFAATEYSGTITLAASQRVPIRMEYFENFGESSARLEWLPPGGAREVIPAAQLYPDLAAPLITPAAGAYGNSIIVSISSYAAGATVHYTTDGTAADTGDPVYAGPFPVSATTAVRAIAVKTGMTASPEATSLFTINDTTAPVLLSAVPVGPSSVKVFFSEPLQTASAQTAGNYLVNGVAATAAVLNGPTNTNVTITTAAPLAAGTTYTLTVTGVSDNSAAANPVAPGSQTTFIYAPAGFQGIYFDNVDFTGAQAARADATVNFDWGNTTPASPDSLPGALTATDTFSVRWIGRLVPDFSETTTIHVTSDDGVRLWINGVQVINDWYDRGATTSSVSVALGAGQKTDFRLDYYENLDLASVRLEWESPSQPRTVIPTDHAVLQGPAPTISPAGGTYTSSVAVTLASNAPGAEIRYTTDGSVPTAGSILYGGPFPIGSTLTLRARTFVAGLEPSETTSANFAVADGTAPALTCVSATRATRVMVQFSEALDATSAQTAANYSIVPPVGPAITVSAATLGPDLRTVALTTGVLTAGVPYTLTVSGVTDAAVPPNPVAPGSGMTFQYVDPANACLVERWPFDEGAGTTLSATVTTPGNDGTITNGPEWVTGPCSFALRFDGVDDFVVGGLTNIPAANAAQTISWWQYVASNPTNVQNPIALVNPGGGTGVQAGFRPIGAGGAPMLVIWQWGGGTLVSAPPPSAGAWHHIAYTFDATTHTLYVDGVSVNSSTVAPQVGAPTELNFGRYSGGEYYAGLLSDVRIYNCALTPGEIGGLANQEPVVNAGPDLTTVIGALTALNGSATDDNLPAPGLTTLWTQVSGPAAATINTPTSPTTTATFPAAGVYRLRLTASDGQLSSSDDVLVFVSLILIGAPSGTTTSETGTTVTFTIVLGTAPAGAATVTVGLSSSNPAEGSVFPPSVSFNAGNWFTPVLVTVTGVDDPLVDGTVPYSILTAPAVSADPAYSGLDAPDVALANVSDDVPAELDPAWGNCGATGGEALLLLGLLALLRRRR